MILAGYLVLNFIVDNVIKPRVMQSSLDVPPLLGLLSLLVWGYLLGPPGAPPGAATDHRDPPGDS